MNKFCATDTITALARFSMNMTMAVLMGISSRGNAVWGAEKAVCMTRPMRAPKRLVSDPFGMARVDLECGQKASADCGEDDG